MQAYVANLPATVDLETFERWLEKHWQKPPRLTVRRAPRINNESTVWYVDGYGKPLGYLQAQILPTGAVRVRIMLGDDEAAGYIPWGEPDDDVPGRPDMLIEWVRTFAKDWLREWFDADLVLRDADPPEEQLSLDIPDAPAAPHDDRATSDPEAQLSALIDRRDSKDPSWWADLDQWWIKNCPRYTWPLLAKRVGYSEQHLKDRLTSKEDARDIRRNQTKSDDLPD